MQKDTVLLVGGLAAIATGVLAVKYVQKRRKEKRRERIIAWSVGGVGALGSLSSVIGLFAS